MEVSIDYSLLIAVSWDAEDFDDAVRRRRGRLTAHKSPAIISGLPVIHPVRPPESQAAFH